ncbi:hypothetical protein, partial [Hymenobacter norwichensis]|uniref:hypothetical protein n=1 Tax=Hymenobacter norwichensis TaxID=223903 RepID=UPI000524EF60
KLPTDVLEPYGVVAERLYVPVQATLWPAATPEELRTALLWPCQLWHPRIGLVGFDTTDELDLLTLLEYAPARVTDWTRAHPGLTPKPRLQQIRVLPTSVGEVLRTLQEDIGTAPLTELPGLAESTPSWGQQQWDAVRYRLLHWSLSLLRSVPGTGNRQTARILGLLGTIVLIGIAGVLLLSLFRSLTSGNIGTLVAVAVVILIRALSNVSNGKSGSPTRPNVPARPGIFQRLDTWLNGSIQGLEKKRNREIERLLRLFQDNPAEALKYAIPLDGPYQDRGRAPATAQLGPRATDFNLGQLGGGRPTDVWDLAEYQVDLRRQYLAAARQEVAAGRYQKAAYIHAHLLGDYHAAAQVLEQGQLFREAAALYQDHLRNRPAAAQSLERGGLLLEAAELFADLGQHEKAGDLHQQLAQPVMAARHYERGVAVLLANGDQPAAARLAASKLLDRLRAQTILLTGWAGAKQPETCLEQYFDLIADEPSADLSAAVHTVYQEHTSLRQGVPLLRVLATVVERHATPTLLNASREIAYEVVSREAQAGNVASLALLRSFQPTDRLLAADCSRYTTRPLRLPVAETIPVNPSGTHLDATITWQSVVNHHHQWVAVGIRDNRVQLARGNWYGNIEYYSWLTLVAPQTNLVLLADERHGNQLLLRCSTLVVLELQVLPRNKYFSDALTVDCPSWLPAWPIRVALLPDGMVATAEVQGSTLTVQPYAASGQLLPPLMQYLSSDSSTFVGMERGWPSELLYRDGVYYSYWGEWLVWWNEQGKVGTHELAGVVYQLVCSPYTQELQLVVGLEGGMQLWAPTSLPDAKPDLLCQSSTPEVDMRFVGLEHVVGIQESEAQVLQLTSDGLLVTQSIIGDKPFIAVLSTADRKHFALVDVSGRIQLYPLNQQEDE